MQHQRRWAVLPIVVLIVTSLACGGFQVRVTPTPTLEPGETPTAEPTRVFAATPEPTEAPAPVAVEPTPAPATPTLAPTAAPAVRKARVLATGGLNVRDAASSKGKLVGRVAANAVYTILEGPTKADNYDWYRIDAGGGVTGWIASGPANDPWLKVEEQQAAAQAGPSPTTVALKLVDRAIKAGDRVQVTTESTQVLTVRQDAGKGARAVAKVPRGTLFTVKSGPVQQDGMTWWELSNDTVKGWAAEGDAKTRWLTPVE